VRGDAYYNTDYIKQAQAQRSFQAFRKSLKPQMSKLGSVSGHHCSETGTGTFEYNYAVSSPWQMKDMHLGPSANLFQLVVFS